MRAIEEGPGQIKRHEELMGGMYLLVNTLLQESLDSLNPTRNEDEVSESQDDESEEGEIKEAFRAEEYEGIYLELGPLLSCEVRLRDASDRAQRMMQRYLVRDDHLFVRREVGNPRKVVCGRNRQIDVIAALHDGIAGGHRGIQATYAKISELYYWDEMMDMIGKFCRSCVPCQERSRLRKGESLHPRSDFTKTAMPRGGKGRRPPRRPLGASGGYERHGTRHREGTPVYDDRDIERFQDSFWDHARRMGWTVAQAIERLRGASRFEEPIARIRREATMRPEVEMRMQLRPSSVGPDGRSIRLEIENAADFIPIFEWFMQGQEEQEAEDPEPSEARPSRGGRKALARREEESDSEDEERGAYPECGIGPVEFRHFTEGGLRKSPVRTQEETPTSEGPLRELEAHLDVSRWGASPRGEEHGGQAEEVPREEVPCEEVPREETPREEVRDTQHLAAHALEHPDLEEPAPAEPRREPCQPENEVEAEIPKRVDHRTRERAPTGETVEEKRARRSRRIEEIWQERQRLEAAGALPEQQQERQRLEAAGALPDQSPSAPTKTPEIPEMWRNFWEQRAEGLPSPTRAGFEVARKAEERLDRKIKFLAKTCFNRYLMVESDLAGKKMKEEGHGLRLETMEVEIQELRPLVASQVAIIEDLRQQRQGRADKAESNRQGEQRQPGQGSPG
ncbi:hypothetical protein CBR_g4557 [Chara braunii]|uniref:Integrase zinc-binding domain-containing protein n=1 Tax=Chara braunii TaxID=69332 RepID=A0A388KI66_CHABU|nr:hypothetical protein CBR_g4557 [Chara braunii]|eukprot:GBG69726.1 hypothetical protein CBR_g4557 [Chara braunii]